jgi:predicted nucleotidyltransferase
MAAERITAFTTPAADDPALAETVRRLLAAYQPERIYLFGSVARGDADPDSDYDLLVAVPDDAPLERRRSRLAYEALHGTGTAADVLVCTAGWGDPIRTPVVRTYRRAYATARVDPD